MTTYNALSALRAAMETVVAQWALTHDDPLPVWYDNQKFAPPEDATTWWVRLSLLPGERRQASTGAPGQNTYRTPGVWRAAIYGPKGAGDANHHGLAASITAAYKAAQAPGLVVRGGGPGPGREDGAWWRVDVTGQWHNDEVG